MNLLPTISITSYKYISVTDLACFALEATINNWEPSYLVAFLEALSF